MSDDRIADVRSISDDAPREVNVNRLTIRVNASTPNYPKVRLLIDGEDLLASTGNNEGNDPADILDTGALLPVEPARRIAFYGCGCGEFGCANVAGVITRRDDRIEWTDFRSLTGVYHSALCEPEDGPDPATTDEWDAPSRRHDLPTLSFDAADYLVVVREAMADRSWETRPRAVIRHIRARRPEMKHWAARHGESITVHHLVNGMAWSTDLPVPSGPPDRLAVGLVALLDQGVDPRAIEVGNMWA
jgi:hypothetical protein